MEVQFSLKIGLWFLCPNLRQRPNQTNISIILPYIRSNLLQTTPSLTNSFSSNFQIWQSNNLIEPKFSLTSTIQNSGAKAILLLAHFNSIGPMFTSSVITKFIDHGLLCMILIINLMVLSVTCSQISLYLVQMTK
jgi:hypothetical protein